MKIKGLIKTTLIDYPGHIACTLFLYGCNFKCGFCHNPELVLGESTPDLKQEEVLDFLQRRKKYLEGVCITGGEPLLTIEKSFLEKIKKMGYKIKIDTNGAMPEKLKELVQEGLVDFVAMDIKSSREKYSEVCGVDVSLDKIEESIRIIVDLPEYEFRTTIVPGIHSGEEVLKMAEWVNNVAKKTPKRYALQGFKVEEKILNPEFKNKKNTQEEELEKIKEVINDSFEDIEIRV